MTSSGNFDRGVHKYPHDVYGGAMDVIATEARGRGRPRQFDEDEVLDALVQLFWSRGFDDASLNEIVEAAGLNKSSLYNAFGSKDEVFFAVLDRYLDFRSGMLAEMFDGDRVEMQ